MAGRSWRQARIRRMWLRLVTALAALAVASLFAAGWMINEAVIEDNGDESPARESLAQELSQSSPSTENKDAESFAAYGRPKDPFRQILEPKTGEQAQADVTDDAGERADGAGGGVITPSPPRIPSPGGGGRQDGGFNPGSPTGGGGRGQPSGGQGGGFNPGAPTGGRAPDVIRKRGGDRFDEGRGRGRGGIIPGGGAGGGTGRGAGGDLPTTGGKLPFTGGELPYMGDEFPFAEGSLPVVYK